MAVDNRKREGHQLLLRFPENSDLRDRLDQIARSNNRSLTAEIIHRLMASLEIDGDEKSVAAADALLRMGLHDDPLKDLKNRVAALEAKIAKLAGE